MKYREWSKLSFIDPAAYLAGLRKMLRELIPQLQPHAAFAMKIGLLPDSQTPSLGVMMKLEVVHGYKKAVQS